MCSREGNSTTRAAKFLPPSWCCAQWIIRTIISLLYGSLRSIFFGLSDEDLLQAHIGGLPLDYRKEVPRESPLCHPFEILRDLHGKRHERRASETFEVLLQKTGAREVLAVRGFQSLANLNKLGRTLRAFQGDATFSQVIDLLDTIDEEELAESESRLMEERSNAVRIMSIHKAKGLDFPIVFAAALGLRNGFPGAKMCSWIKPGRGPSRSKSDQRIPV